MSPSMWRYLRNRIFQIVIVLGFASIAVFVLIRLLPGDPAQLYAGPDAPAAVIRAVHSEMGLDAPLPVQYLVWVQHISRGDLGRSFANNYPVARLLEQRMGATIELAATALILALALSIPSGILAAVNEGSPSDYLITGLSSIGLAVPPFWVGIMLIFAFAIDFHWLPASGYAQLGPNLAPFVRHLLMPAFTLALPIAAILTRFVKSGTLEVLTQDYARTAYAKGLSRTRVLLRHVVPNSLVAVATVVGLNLGNLLGGAVIVESVFAWPGVGLLLLGSVLNRDYAILQGGLLTFVFIFMVINLLTDLAYSVIDPRVRLG